MERKNLWYLENIDVSGIFCPKKVNRGDMERNTHKSFSKGDYIYMPREHADKVYFIEAGRVKVGHYSSDGKEITKAILGEGEVFGELSLIGEEKRRDFAFAMEDTELCMLSVEDIKSLMREYTPFSIFMMKILGSRVLTMEKRLESLVFKDSRTRIVEFLLELVDKKGQRVGYEWLVRKFLTHQEIANLTATSRQTVTTVLNELRNKDILTFNRRRLLVRELDQLKAEADPVSGKNLQS